jgi:hypothetical protein
MDIERVMGKPPVKTEDVVSKIRNVLKDPEYTGGTKGNLILHLANTNKTYFIRIRDLKYKIGEPFDSPQALEATMPPREVAS